MFLITGHRHRQAIQIIIPLSVDEISEWFNSFVLVPKPKRKVCLNPVTLNQVLIRPIHGGPETTYIFPKLTCVHYLTLIGTSSRYHNMKPDKKSSYLTTFAYQLSRYRYARLPFSAAPTDDMFQRKIDEIVKDHFDTADKILLLGYDKVSADHNNMIKKVLKICRQEILELNIHKCHLRCTRMPFWI